MDTHYLVDARYPDEEWRFVPDFDRYLVSSYGRVFNTDKHSFLSGRVVWNGSIRVKLSQDGRDLDSYLHNLVAEVYFDDYFQGMHVRHINGNKKDNHVSNLEVVGPFREKGPRYRPDYRGGKLVRIVETNEIFANVMNLALALETDTSTIYKCLRGERHRHLGFTFEYVE